MDIQRVLKELGTSFKRFVRRFDRLDREVISNIYLKGSGIEVGALHCPVILPKHSRVKYVDRMSTPDLHKKYPSLSRDIVHVDIIDDGEHLSTIQDESQDFVIANGFIEHCRNPILALRNFLRVVKKGGIVYLAIPDKRYTFDVERAVTPYEHVLRDYKEGPAWGSAEHVREYLMLVDKLDEEKIAARMPPGSTFDEWDIHWHVWTQREMFEFIVPFREEFGFEVELFLRMENECIFILQKG